ncbi:oligosaccharide flippase family protein [Novosphingobium sp. M1R2S20]|uniref:Oligosaccharide flippase family protein n=1 Tax=Novosphingobium rhizovicinum TaxID=3228928 RepID=A0ABV3R7X2_9SPHN
MSSATYDAVPEGTGTSSKSKSLKSDALWTGLDIFVSSGLAFAFRLVAAKFLAPADFGIIAVAMTSYAVVQVINEFGLSATIIQREQARFSIDLVNTAYTASCVLSVALLAINTILIAPVATIYFNSASVGYVTTALGIAFLGTPFVSIGRALMFRERRYRQVTMSRVISTVASLAVAATWLAFDRSVWVLVAQLVSAQILLAVAITNTSDWTPKLLFRRDVFKEAFSYSGLVFANDLFVSVARNFDVITLGRILTQYQVGLYSLAFYITDVARTNLMSVLNRVMFTQYSSVQGDLTRVRHLYVRTLAWNCAFIFPVMILIIMAGPSLTTHFLGSDWLGMTVPLQILAVSVIIHAAGGTTSTVYKALGRPGLDLALFAFTSVVILLPLLIVATLWLGVVGAAIAIATNKLISVLIRQYYLDKLVGATALRVVKIVAELLLAQLPIVAVFLAVRFVWPEGRWLGELLAAVIAGGAYFGIAGAIFLRARKA